MICWTSFGVNCLQIHGGQLNIVINHIQSGMPHKHPQCQRIATIAQEMQGKGVTKAMRMNVLDLRLLGIVVQYLTYSVRSEGPSLLSQEERF